MPRRHDIITLELVFVHQTDKAILVKKDEGDDEKIWLPLSVAQVDKKIGRVVTLSMPEDIAYEKGLI